MREFAELPGGPGRALQKLLTTLMVSRQKLKGQELLAHYQTHGSCHLVTLELTITGPLSDSSQLPRVD